MTSRESLRLKKAFSGFVLFLLITLLVLRLLYLHLSDATRYPVTKIKIISNYEHLHPEDLKPILMQYQSTSFFLFPVATLYKELHALPWVSSVNIKRIFPSKIHITVEEKHPIATWNGAFLTSDLRTFSDPSALAETLALPHLIGPEDDLQVVLDMYHQINTFLAPHHLSLRTLQRRDNHAWIAILNNGIRLKLGKQEVLLRAQRFTQLYATLAESPTPIRSVDLRYPKGVAVQYLPPPAPTTATPTTASASPPLTAHTPVPSPHLNKAAATPQPQWRP